jgi:hypothetical protein
VAGTSPAADAPAPANPPPVAKNGAAPTAAKPVLTRPAKPSAIIAASHSLATRPTRPLGSTTEAKLDARFDPKPEIKAEAKPELKTLAPPAAEAKPAAASSVGAPLMIMPSGIAASGEEASVASAESAEPAETPATADKGVDNRPTSTSGPSYSIRLASSLSESDAHATLSQLQRQFPGALQSGSVSRDNLGSIGVFYRVRIGPLSRESAEKVCSRLRAAGRKCFLTHG